MSSYLTQLGQSALRWQMGPASFMPSMADIAPQFPQPSSIQSKLPYSYSSEPRFQKPGWVRTLADFFSTAPQAAAAAGLPFVMQMSGDGESSVKKPTHPKSKKWERYYASLDDAGLKQAMEAQREEMIAYVRGRAQWINDEFVDHLSPQVMALDPLDTDYWEHVEQCIYRDSQGRFISLQNPNAPELMPSCEINSKELGQALSAAFERLPALFTELGLVDLMVVYQAAWFTTKCETTVEDLEFMLEEMTHSCTTQRTDSGSLFDALPDEGGEYCPDPLGEG